MSLPIPSHIKIENKEQGIEMLKKHLGVRNQMGGALYYGIAHEECEAIADEIKYKHGATKDEIAALFTEFA